MVKQIPDHVFRGYDLRGIVGSELDEESVELIAKGYATILLQKIKKAIKINVFNTYTFEKQNRPCIIIQLAADILTANEAGFTIETQAKLSPDTTINLQAPLLEQMQCDNAVIRTTKTQTKYVPVGRYINELNIIGLKRNDGSYLVNPAEDTNILKDDVIFVLGKSSDIKSFKERY